MCKLKNCAVSLSAETFSKLISAILTVDVDVGCQLGSRKANYEMSGRVWRLGTDWQWRPPGRYEAGVWRIAPLHHPFGIAWEHHYSNVIAGSFVDESAPDALLSLGYHRVRRTTQICWGKKCTQRVAQIQPCVGRLLHPLASVIPLLNLAFNHTKTKKQLKYAVLWVVWG